MERLLRVLFLALSLSPVATAGAQQFGTTVTGVLPLSLDSQDDSSLWLKPREAAIVRLDGDIRFFRGVEIRVSSPVSWFAHSGSLLLSAYADLGSMPGIGFGEFSGRKIISQQIPARIQSVYQIPLRENHGLITGPFSMVSSEVTVPESFPVMLVLEPATSNLDGEVAQMSFLLSARPILSNEGAVRFITKYPQQMPARPFTVLVNNMAVENLSEEKLLPEGEHHLAVVSEDYRNHSRRFMVERAKSVDIVIELQDPTPVILFEAPQDTRISLNGSGVSPGSPVTVEPGIHEARFYVGDYVFSRAITVQRGKTYRISLNIDIDVSESE